MFTYVNGDDSRLLHFFLPPTRFSECFWSDHMYVSKRGQIYFLFFYFVADEIFHQKYFPFFFIRPQII